MKNTRHHTSLVCTVAFYAYLAHNPAFAQSFDNLPGDDLHCLFNTEEVGLADIYAFPAEERADQIVEQIVRVAGMAKTFKLRTGDVPNICARTDENQNRYIVYSTEWLNQITRRSQANPWLPVIAFAHEIGHHANGHPAKPGGSRPDHEIEADVFAGTIAARLGASLQQTLEIVSVIQEQSTTASLASDDYPELRNREQALRFGWRTASPVQPLTPLPLTPLPIPPQPNGANDQIAGTVIEPEPNATSFFTPDPPPQPEPATTSFFTPDPPPQPEPVCRLEEVPTTFQTVQETVVVEEPSQRLEVIPATYKTLQRRMLVAEDHYSEDKMQTVTKTVVVEEPSERLVVVPATYKTVSETILVQPPYERLSITDDGQSVRQIAVPGQTRTIQRRVLDSTPTVRRVAVAGKTATVPIKQIAESTGQGTYVPAEYKTIQTRVIDTPSSTRLVEVSGKTATITIRKIASPATTRRVCS